MSARMEALHCATPRPVVLLKTFEQTDELDNVTASAELRITAMVWPEAGDVELLRCEVEDAPNVWRDVPPSRVVFVEQNEDGAIVERIATPVSVEEASDQIIRAYAESWLDDNHARAHEALQADLDRDDA